MSWTKLDDLWSEKIEEVVSDHSARWHYLALIQLCSRLEARDGIVTRAKAERCSDLPDTRQALSTLADAGLVVDMGNRIKVTRAAEHVISEAKQAELERNRENQRRSRAHRNGDHDECIPGDGDRPSNCSHASHGESDSHRDTTPTHPRDSGGVDQQAPVTNADRSPMTSGRDGPGREATSPPDVDFETGEVLDSASTPSSPPSMPSVSEAPEHRPADPFGSTSSSSASSADGPASVDFHEFMQQFGRGA